MSRTQATAQDPSGEAASIIKTARKKTYTIVIARDLEENGFVGRCDELHAVSEGDTFGQVMENVREAVELAVEERGDPSDFDMLVIQQ